MKYVIIDDVEYPLVEVPPQEMDKILMKAANRELVAIPCWWDSIGRIWPTPPEGMKVQER